MKYVFGFEESYGCLIGDYARDKDGIAAVMALCEAACYYASKGKHYGMPWKIFIKNMDIIKKLKYQS